MMKQPTILLLSLAHAATVVLLAVATSAGTTALAFAPSYRMPSRPTVFSNHLSLQPSLSHRTSQQKLRRHVVCYSSSSSTAGGESDDLVAPPGTNSTSSSSSSSTDDILDTTPAKRSFVQSVREYFAPAKDGLTFRQRLAKMGLAAVLSYGWVSNMSYCVSVSLAWYIFSKQTGLSPLAPGQWKPFLAVYAGFWVFNNFIRPVRLAASVAISPQFEKVVLKIQNRFKVSKGVAIGITVVLANLVGTTAFMCAGILVASIAAGVPVFPSKVIT